MSQTLIKRLTAAFLAVVIVVNVGVFQATRIASATALTSVTDVTGDQTQSVSANHLITFTTPSGASAGETVTITFASEFDTSLIDEDDVDVSDDGIQQTTAADCFGAEQASVTVGGDVVTITLCASGAIAPGSVVQVSIGTSATNSGVGNVLEFELPAALDRLIAKKTLHRVDSDRAVQLPAIACAFALGFFLGIGAPNRRGG